MCVKERTILMSEAHFKFSFLFTIISLTNLTPYEQYLRDFLSSPFLLKIQAFPIRQCRHSQHFLYSILSESYRNVNSCYSSMRKYIIKSKKCQLLGDGTDTTKFYLLSSFNSIYFCNCVQMSLAAVFIFYINQIPQKN